MPIYDKNQSRIKMYVLRSGKKKNITWYSIITKDHQRTEIICQSMLQRFNNYCKAHPEIIGTINKIIFYEKGNQIGEATL